MTKTTTAIWDLATHLGTDDDDDDDVAAYLVAVQEWRGVYPWPRKA
jgi:hypothetical protein